MHDETKKLIPIFALSPLDHDWALIECSPQTVGIFGEPSSTASACWHYWVITPRFQMGALCSDSFNSVREDEVDRVWARVFSILFWCWQRFLSTKKRYSSVTSLRISPSIAVCGKNVIRINWLIFMMLQFLLWSYRTRWKFAVSRSSESLFLE